MATIKRVFFIRHGQGNHNLKDEKGQSNNHLFDPILTPKGEQEACDVFSRKPLPKLDVAFVSPLWRTLQTATLAISAAWPEGHEFPLVAYEGVREANNRSKCNHRKPITQETKDAFPLIDFTLVDSMGPASEEEYRDNIKDEIQCVRARGREVFDFLAQRPESCIAVFSHAGFIRSITAVCLGLNCNHSVETQATGSLIEFRLMDAVDGQHYWEIGSSVTVSAV